MRRYRYKRLYEWNASTAYITGLIASDGCLINNGRHINITSNDFDLLESVKSYLELNGRIGSKKNGFGGSSYYLQFSNVAFYDFLLSTNLSPAKSKTIGELAVPDTYYFDFLRGYFDGDGTVYGYWDNRWANSLMFYTSYASASTSFLEWLSITNARLGNLSPGKLQLKARVHTLTYAKQDSRKLFELMYYSSMQLYLSRKRDKFVDFLSMDPYASKELHARVAKSVDASA